LLISNVHRDPIVLMILLMTVILLMAALIVMVFVNADHHHHHHPLAMVKETFVEGLLTFNAHREHIVLMILLMNVTLRMAAQIVVVFANVDHHLHHLHHLVVLVKETLAEE